MLDKVRKGVLKFWFDFDTCRRVLHQFKSGVQNGVVMMLKKAKHTSRANRCELGSHLRNPEGHFSI